MLRKHHRWMLPLGGAFVGLLFGLTYWFAWGCRSCAKDNSPYAIIAFFVVTSAVMAASWGKDHIQTPLS